MRLHAIQQFYSNRLGLVALDDDVQSIVKQVRELYGDRVGVHMDEDSGEYYFTEYCEDGTERLIFATPELDNRALERLIRADSQTRGYEDPYLAAEKAQDDEQAAADAAKLDQVHDASERLAHALRKDGADSPMPLKVFIGDSGGL